jgi:hypothetical protein
VTRPGAILLVALAACAAPTGSVEQFPEEGRDHLSAGDPVPEYATDPPTSGAHAPVWSRCGVHDEPIPEVVQVHDLEHGVVMVQHDPNLAGEDLAELRDLAGTLESHVIIAPRTGLPAPVVATAWTVMLRLDKADSAAIIRFWEDHAQRGPEQRACPVEDP